ncbi:DNA mismatch repair endonuclease MutL [Enterobacteriaceae endosymbiont of Donacia tomentosa]|uniref:DNA mismatch repair endonuclease MutL n=1 Tax=Enterobacteriaceae endosymbiont of Donacia tomentosa TaxID=2675787 RepID=UPI00144968C8|nr:DNA mismatch repair endonuclease MutL [Enterobacteriaceae endosymbiont of Donacia tomentosa]QJC31619.1 DNA mismatch repair endonuclease MutL [Enterobacteriaceae endosymbiont of Donacia tomentosa]
MSIKILPKNVIKRIAAGEVIDRPASIIKELIENSIDAKASKITIHIKKGGLKYININDNGIGMNKKSLVLCIKKHATSKITNLDDLDSFKSFGFRGEALTSIKSISRMTIISKTLKQTIAWQMYTEGLEEKIIYLKPTAHPTGTTIILTDLFYTFPARRKYISNENIEFIYIKKIIKLIILMKFNISIKFQYNNKIIYNFEQVTDNFSYLNRIKSICGTNFIKNALKINSTYKKLKLRGWILISEYQLKNSFKYFYVNNRIINNNFINRILKEILQNKFCHEFKYSFLIFLEIEQKQIDINIHPRKKDIFFYQAKILYDFIHQSIVKILHYPISNLNSNKEKHPTKLNNNFLSLNKINSLFIKNNFSQETELLFNNIQKKKLVYLHKMPIFHFKHFGKFLIVLKNSHIIVEKKEKLYFLSIKEIVFFLLKKKFELYFEKKYDLQQIKLNLKLKITKEEYFNFCKIKRILLKLGFDFILSKKKIIHIKLIPLFLSFYDIKIFFLNLLKYNFNIHKNSVKNIFILIIDYMSKMSRIWNYNNIVDLLMELELFKLEHKTFCFKKLFFLINIEKNGKNKQ